MAADCWTVLHVSILAALLLTLNADSEDSKCDVEIKVRRNTVYEASLGEDLRINCTVSFCNNPPPTVSWYKMQVDPVAVNISSRIKTEWKTVNHLEGTSFLIFQNILRDDEGQYQCQSGGSVGHVINVSVSVKGDGEHNDTTKTTATNVTSSSSDLAGNLWMYVYPAAGIVAFVILVIIISVAAMQGCKGKSKKEALTDNQYMAIPMFEQPVPQPGLQPSPRGSPSAPPSRRSTRRKAPPPQTSEPPLPRDNEHVYGKVKEDRERQVNMAAGDEEEGSSVVYAALNHQLPPRAAARPRRPKEESSEYAAIRVKDPNTC